MSEKQKFGSIFGKGARIALIWTAPARDSINLFLGRMSATGPYRSTFKYGLVNPAAQLATHSI